MLNVTQQGLYRDQGFLVLPDFKSPAEIATLRARAEAIVEDFDATANRAIFSTREQERKVDDYFLDSATEVRCFFEEEAFDASGALRQPKSLSINKIGHAMHDLDPVFSQFSHSPKLAELAVDLGLVQPQIWQSMYIFKQPGIGGEVCWHQDASFFNSDPITVTTFWFALEDATVANGCIWAEPGGHLGQKGVLRARFVRQGRQVTMEVLDTTPWPGSDVEALPLEVKAGTLIVFHGLLPHYSAPNRSAASRHAYTLHVTDGASAYSPSNWIQRDAALPVRGFVSA